MWFPLAIASLLTALSGPSLNVGDHAPPLKVAAIVKGKAVNLNKGIHVVEFWATWCAPCQQSIPHLTDMAKKYREKVDFTGVSISESGENQLGHVREFVAKMGSKMGYNVAFDGPAKAMDLGYMKAAGQDGIPTAFLIQDGTILWIGHPMGALEGVIDRVLAGSFDVATAKKEAVRRANQLADDEKKSAEQDAKMAPAKAAFGRKDFELGLRELDKIDTSRDAALADRVLMKRFYVLAFLGDPRLPEVARKVVAEKREEADFFLSVIARDLVTPESKFPKACGATALILAEAAVAIAPNRPMVLDTYAFILSKVGKVKEAVEAESKAISCLKADPKFDAKDLKSMQDRLEILKGISKNNR